MKHLPKFALTIAAATLAAGFTACSSGIGGSASDNSATVELIIGNNEFLSTNQTLSDSLESFLSQNDFTGMSPWVNGYARFTRKENYTKLQSIYKFDGSNFAKITDKDFSTVGFMNEDRIPVLNLDGSRSVLDSDGNEVFNASEVDGVKVSAISCIYSEGLLWFELTNSRLGCFDRDGNVAFLLEPTALDPSIDLPCFVDGFIFMYYCGSNVTINRKGEIMHDFGHDRMLVRVGNKIHEAVRISGDNYETVLFSPEGEETGRQPDDSGRVDYTDENTINESIEQARPFNIKPLIDKYKDNEDALRIIQNMRFQFRI